MKSRGFTLIEVMIVAGIMGISALAFSFLLTSQARNARYIEDSLTKLQIANELQKQLGNIPVCESSLMGMDLAGKVANVTLKNQTGANVLKPGDKLDNVEVADIEVDPVTSNPNSYNNTTVRVTMNRLNTIDTRALAAIEMNVPVYLNGARQVAKCQSKYDLKWQAYPYVWKSNGEGPSREVIVDKPYDICMIAGFQLGNNPSNANSYNLANCSVVNSGPSQWRVHAHGHISDAVFCEARCGNFK